MNSLSARRRGKTATEATTARRSTSGLGPVVILSSLLAAALLLAVTYGVNKPTSGATGWASPVPFRWLARVTGLSSAPHGVQESVTIAAWLGLGAAFLFVCREAWAGRLPVRLVLFCAIGLQILAMLAVPVRRYSDIYQYSIYGRIVSHYHLNPYVVTPRTVAKDPFFALTDPKWRDVTCGYGPAFVRFSALLTQALHSAAQLVIVFKALAGAAGVVTILIVHRLARWIRQERTAFAVALIGLNPAVAMVGVGNAHIDALVGLAVALGLALVVVRWDRAPDHRWPTELAGTAMLTLGALIKFPVAIALALSILLCCLRHPAGRRTFWAAMHLLVVAALVAVVAFPLLQTRNPTLGVFTFARLGNLLAPTTFLWSITWSAASHIGGSAAAQAVSTVVPVLLPAIFLSVFAALLIEGGRTSAIRVSLAEMGPELLLSVCGWAVLLLLLASPQVSPWYFVWILPQAWVLPSLPRVGIAVMSALVPVPLVLAGMTLPHELTRDLQLYVVAPGLLVLFAFLLVEIQRRVRTGTPLYAPGPHSPVAAGP